MNFLVLVFFVFLLLSIKDDDPMFKEIILRIYLLITRPSTAWQKMAEQEEAAHALFFSRFLFPVMGVTALSCFAYLFGKEFNADNLEHVLRIAIVEFVKFFIGFYFLSFVLKEILPHFSQKTGKEDIERYVGSILVLYMMVDIVVNILPEGFSFLEYASLALFYYIWTGAKYFLLIDDSRQKIFTLVSTIMVLVTPIVIERILFLMMPGMNR